MPDLVRQPVKLHLDADTSRKALLRALLDRGHDVTRTPDSWIHREASDETQLLRATVQGRAVFTFNIRTSRSWPRPTKSTAALCSPLRGAGRSEIS